MTRMMDCPHCRQPVEQQAIACPYCGTALKAYGHPGMPLHRASGTEYLCATCVYDEDDTCTFPQRPYAKDCTLYTTPHSLQRPTSSVTKRPASLNQWFRRHGTVLVVIGLIVVSLLLALSGR